MSDSGFRNSQSVINRQRRISLVSPNQAQKSRYRNQRDLASTKLFLHDLRQAY